MNNVENYVLDEANKTVQVDFTYCKSSSSKTSLLQQRAKVVNDSCTAWEISPKLVVYLPLRIAYLIVDCAEDYSTTIIGVPDRSYIWIMARTPSVDDATMESLLAKARSLGYDATKLVKVPQQWE